jgi:7,8-dihydro-6-hydroxymethylpterin-pyrophosphokinase
MANHCLLGYGQDTLLGTEAIRQSLSSLIKDFSIEKVSSIYKRYFSARNEDLNSELIFVFKAVTHLEPEGLLEKLIAFNKLNGTNSAKMELLLLSYDQLVMLNPKIPLPHPRLVQDPAILRCASEVWGDFNHPILDKTLNEVVKSVYSFEHIEFFSRGDSLL